MKTYEPLISLERKTGFGPATPTLARLCSTTELLPQYSFISYWWRDPELNWGHTDFQSVALPTELSRHLSGVEKVAELTGLEPATSGVTGQRSNQIELQLPAFFNLDALWWAE